MTVKLVCRFIFSLAFLIRRFLSRVVGFPRRMTMPDRTKKRMINKIRKIFQSRVNTKMLPSIRIERIIISTALAVGLGGRSFLLANFQTLYPRSTTNKRIRKYLTVKASLIGQKATPMAMIDRHKRRYLSQ